MSNLKKIITVTLNPAYDVHCNLKSFIPFSENYVDSSEYYAGGKGINISRALLSAGTDSTAVVLLGQDNCSAFEEGLKNENICYAPIYVSGRIRENFTLHCENQKETRISFDSFSCHNSVLKEVEKLITDDITAVAFAGRLPKGMDKESVIKFLCGIKEKGIFLCVDSNSFSLADLIKVSPDFIKPNEVEIKNLCTGDIITAAKQIYASGIPHVLITNGGEPAVYIGAEGLKKITIPKVTPLSTVGAGDSTVAGFLSQYISGSDIDSCLAYAVAFGSAATFKEGTTAPEKQDIKRLIKEVEIKNL